MIFIKLFAKQRKEIMFSLPQGAVSAWEAVALPGKFCPHLVPILHLCEHRLAAAQQTAPGREGWRQKGNSRAIQEKTFFNPFPNSAFPCGVCTAMLTQWKRPHGSGRKAMGRSWWSVCGTECEITCFWSLMFCVCAQTEFHCFS